MILIKNVSKIIFNFYNFFNCFGLFKKDELSVKPPDENEAYQIYKEGLDAMNNGDFFFAAKKFSEAEKILPVIEQSAKALLMNGFCYYSINFHDEAIASLENFLRKYPADKNVQYASYLIALSNYEQILDEKRDLKPLLTSKKIIKEYIKKYPETDYALDLKFKLDLIQNQLAAKKFMLLNIISKLKNGYPQ